MVAPAERAPVGFAAGAESLLGELNDLDSKLTAGLGEWDVAAQQSYWRFQAQWNAAAHHMQVLLARYEDAPHS
jgi:uncharacterized protein YukE